MFALHLGLGSA